MPKFPEPPSALSLPPDIFLLAAGTMLWRVYFTAGAHPSTWNGFRFFGPVAARFDHHDGPPHNQTLGIQYSALSPLTSIAEFFQATRMIDRSARRPWLAGFQVTSDLSLLDLTNGWPTRAGASMAINSGPRPRARRWSRLIHASYPDVHGLYYPSSMRSNQPCCALYERAQGAMPASPVFNRALADPALLARLATAAATLGYKLV
jgi:hypothetical protein